MGVLSRVHGNNLPKNKGHRLMTMTVFNKSLKLHTKIIEFINDNLFSNQGMVVFCSLIYQKDIVLLCFIDIMIF